MLRRPSAKHRRGAELAKKYNVPVLCLSGGLGKGYEDAMEHGVDALATIVPGPMTLEECMGLGLQLIEEGIIRLCLALKVGIQIGSGFRT